MRPQPAARGREDGSLCGGGPRGGLRPGPQQETHRICRGPRAQFFFPEALRRVLLLKAAANFTCQLLMPTCRELLHLPTSHANLSRVTSPANFSCQLVESYFTC